MFVEGRKWWQKCGPWGVFPETLFEPMRDGFMEPQEKACGGIRSGQVRSGQVGAAALYEDQPGHLSQAFPLMDLEFYFRKHPLPPVQAPSGSTGPSVLQARRAGSIGHQQAPSADKVLCLKNPPQERRALTHSHPHTHERALFHRGVQTLQQQQRPMTMHRWVHGQPQQSRRGTICTTRVASNVPRGKPFRTQNTPKTLCPRVSSQKPTGDTVRRAPAVPPPR